MKTERLTIWKVMVLHKSNYQLRDTTILLIGTKGAQMQKAIDKTMRYCKRRKKEFRQPEVFSVQHLGSLSA